MGIASRGALVVGAGALLAACGFGFTGDAIDIGSTSATLTGVADRTEPGDITYWFEYGPTAEYGLTTPERTVYTATGEGVTEVVDGLQPHSTYHYRICVDDDYGHGTCGEDRSFTTTFAASTRVEAVTDDAMTIGASWADLFGRAIRSQPGHYTYWFEYGTTPELGTTVPPQEATDVTNVTWAQVRLTGLQPDQAYFFRFCALDEEGAQSCGDTRTFRTTVPRDGVLGGAADELFPGFIIGGFAANVSSEPDGSNPTGLLTIFGLPESPSQFGDPSCLRIVGNRASMGFSPRWPATQAYVAVVEQRTASGSRWRLTQVASAPTSCPDPTTAVLDKPGRPGEGFEIYDAP